MHVTTVTCGSWHTGAVDEDGNLYTWGRGDWGQLGNGSVCSPFPNPGISVCLSVPLVLRVLVDVLCLASLLHCSAHVEFLQRFGSKFPQRLHCFTVAHPTNTLHRTNRPKPKLRPKGGHSKPVFDEMVVRYPPHAYPAPVDKSSCVSPSPSRGLAHGGNHGRRHVPTCLCCDVGANTEPSAVQLQR